MSPVTTVIAPQPTADDRHFWDGLASGQIVLQRCADCHVMRHPPRPMCPHCHSLSAETFASAGTGTVLSWIIPRHPPVPPEQERLVGLVETDEGARLVVNLQGFAQGAVLNDARVELFAAEVDGVLLPQARPLPADRPAGER